MMGVLNAEFPPSTGCLEGTTVTGFTGTAVLWLWLIPTTVFTVGDVIFPRFSSTRPDSWSAAAPSKASNHWQRKSFFQRFMYAVGSSPVARTPSAPFGRSIKWAEGRCRYVGSSGFLRTQRPRPWHNETPQRRAAVVTLTTYGPRTWRTYEPNSEQDFCRRHTHAGVNNRNL